ncbi:hypothetical protein HZS55_17350 [Halosimplex rubrum]|uniref:PGF-CTERM sorting domain-containing protein n=1 Tax=Halosimplex rubrum TaxID=869889 RepID=A0A7D5TNC4_9EURY|nr:BGTF surface domain-containing protein [Halosimplex rubrum]QLH78952.1 hypothetical protein HZS55_17350 [Halosimplex rubrum]
MLGRRADSAFGVLFVLALAVAGTAVLPAFAVAGSGPQPAAAGVGAGGTGCPAAGVAAAGSTGSDASEGAAASRDASGHSLASYPEAPRTDVARGDIAAIQTGIANGRTGTVRIESVDGEFNVSLTFANNDGRKPAILYVNTYLAGNETAVANLAYTAGDNDRVAVADTESVTGAPMPVGAYDVTVETASGTTTQRLTVDEPAVGDLTLLRAPGDRFGELDADEDVAAARASGLISEPPTTDDGPEAALGDTMVYRLNASGFYGLLAAQGGSTSEANFLAAADDGAVDLSITSSGDCESAVDVPGSVDDGTARVIPDPNNETLYVTADLRRVAVRQGLDRGFVGPGRATYAFDARTHVVESNTTTAVDYAVADRQYGYDADGGILVRSAESGQRVAGETNLAPGTNLTIEVAGLDRDYDTSARTTVDDDGTFGVDVDLSDAPNESRFTASIAQIANSQTLLTTGSAAATAVLFEEYEAASSSEADRVENARVALEDGGFLAVYFVPPNEQVTRENLIGRSGYLEPGVHDPTVSLDRPLTDSQNVVLVAHRDDDGDGRFDYPADDSPYRIGGDPVYGVGRVLLDGDGSTPPRDPQYLGVTLPPAEEITGTPVPTATPTDEPTATATPSPTPTATDSDGPVTTTELPPPTLRGTDTPTATPAGTTAPNGTVAPTAPNGTVGPNGTVANGTATVTDGATDGLGPGFGLPAVIVAAVLFGALALSRRE